MTEPRTLEDELREVPRDQYRRPMILQPGQTFAKDCKAGKKGDPLLVGYTRVSSLAKVMDDGVGLDKWHDAMTAVGMVVDPALLDQVAYLVANSTNPYAEHSSSLIRLAAQAQEAAGSTVKRDLGSELHGWAHRWDTGKGLAGLPPELQKDVHGYIWKCADMETLASELFVVVDELQAAGTLDSLKRLPDGRVVVADLKTGGRECDYPMAVEIQVATYAHGSRYDFKTGERAPLHPELDLDNGLLIHAPSGSGKCELYPLNLQRGWDNARAAIDLKERRKRSNRKLKPINVGDGSWTPVSSGPE